MKARLLLALALVLALAGLSYAAFVYYADAALQAQLNTLTQELEQQGYEVSIEDPVINRNEGLITTQGIYLRHEEKQERIQVDVAEIQLSTAEFFRFMIPFAGGVSNIEQLRLRLSGLEYRRERRGTGFDLDFFELSLDGNITDLLQSAASGFDVMPAKQQQLTGRLLNFKAFYDAKLEIYPVKIPFPELSRLFFELEYSPENDRLELQQVEISAFEALMNLSGHIEPVSAARVAAETEDTGQQRSIKLETTLTHEEDDTLRIGADGLGIAFGRLDLSYEGVVLPGKGLRHSLFSEQVSVAARAETFMLTTPQTFRSTYGQPLRFLGISPEGLKLEGISLAYRIQDDRAEITTLELANPYADINFTGALRYRSTSSAPGWDWENAGFHVTPKTAEANRFIQSAGNFFGLRIPVTEPAENRRFPSYQLPLKGRLTAPEIDL